MYFFLELIALTVTNMRVFNAVLIKPPFLKLMVK